MTTATADPTRTKGGLVSPVTPILRTPISLHARVEGARTKVTTWEGKSLKDLREDLPEMPSDIELIVVGGDYANPQPIDSNLPVKDGMELHFTAWKPIQIWIETEQRWITRDVPCLGAPARRLRPIVTDVTGIPLYPGVIRNGQNLSVRRQRASVVDREGIWGVLDP